MTFNLGRRRQKAQSGPRIGALPNLAIGEIGQTVFACPNCGRPLVIGARRCPGCSTRLVMGVQIGRAGVFVMVGLIIGVAFGGGLAAVLSAINRPAHDAQIASDAAAAALASTAPGDPAASTPAVASQTIPSPVASIAPSAPATTIPALSASALSQAISLDEQLRGAAADLKTALAATKFDALGASQLLRNASADAVIGLQLAQNLNAWSGGSAVGGELATFYDAVQSTAADGLGASVTNAAAYRRAATTMVKVLGALDAIDGQARALAASAGISVPVRASPAP